MLPTFVVIGAMKSGTTTLFHNLSAHPDVKMAAQKEVRFFSHDENWRRGVSWYEEQFAGCEGATAIGEVSPAYSFSPVYPDAAPRLASVLPDARLIYIVRDPIERIRSQYLNDTRSGRVTHRDIHRAVTSDDRYLACSSYATQLDRYLDHFDADRILVVTTEALAKSPVETMKRLYAQIGVDPDVSLSDPMARFNRSAVTDRQPRMGLRRVRSAAPIKRAVRRLPPALRDRAAALTSVGRSPDDEALPKETREWLAPRLAPEVERLRPMLPPDFDGWGIAQ